MTISVRFIAGNQILNFDASVAMNRPLREAVDVIVRERQLRLESGQVYKALVQGRQIDLDSTPATLGLTKEQQIVFLRGAA